MKEAGLPQVCTRGEFVMHHLMTPGLFAYLISPSLFTSMRRIISRMLVSSQGMAAACAHTETQRQGRHEHHKQLP